MMSRFKLGFLAFGLVLGICAFTELSGAAKTPVAPIEMAVTLDDLPIGAGEFEPGDRLKATQRIIRVLKVHGVPKAMAFVNTYEVEEDPEQVQCLRAWVKAGYELGNHTHAHTGLANQSARAFILEVKKTEAALARMGLPMKKIIRFPFLEEGTTLKDRMAVRHWLIENGYRFAPPTVDSWDWDTTDKWQAARSNAGRERALENGMKTAMHNFRDARSMARDLFGRDIRHTLLIHQTEVGPHLLQPLFDWYKDNGVTFVPLEKTLRDPIYGLDPGIAMHDMGNFLEMVRSSRDDVKIKHGERLYTTRQAARAIESVSGTGFLCQELFMRP